MEESKIFLVIAISLFCVAAVFAIIHWQTLHAGDILSLFVSGGLACAATLSFFIRRKKEKIND